MASQPTIAAPIELTGAALTAGYASGEQGPLDGVPVTVGAGMPVDPEVKAAVLRAADLFSDAGAEVVELPAFIDEGILRDIDDFWRIRFWRTYLAYRTRRRPPCWRTSPNGCTPAPT